MPYWEIAIITVAFCVSVAVSLYWYARPASAPVVTPKHDPDSVSFLLDDGVLLHASKTAVARHKVQIGVDNWQSVHGMLSGRFPEFPRKAVHNLLSPITLQSHHPEDEGVLHLSQNRGFTQITIQEPITGPVNQHNFENHSELDHLRRVAETSPHPIWEMDQDNEVTWSNLAYAGLYERIHGIEPDPSIPIFEEVHALPRDGTKKRISTELRNSDHTDWYDVLAIQNGGMSVFHAIEVNAIVNSELAQRNFVQTLAKTFAQLSIGLAIFDRNRQLVLFNPALIDLTLLPASFLSGRPALQSFFDRLRENRRMPEPKNYLTWRQEIAKVIAAATDGKYQETWALETGQTYRVRGRPHPDGAIAFLIEDISAEVSLTRNFRAELEQGQALLDTFEDAIAVFSSSGVLTFCNQSYRDMWGLDPESTFADVTIVDSVREWRKKCRQNADWGAITDFIMRYDNRKPWDMAIGMSDGQALTCHVAPIVSGATAIRFQREKSPAQLTVIAKDHV